jgi:rhamnosyltransferase subunit B
MGAEMQILITTLGSAGDVHPMLGLGVALRQRAYPVAVIVGDYFRSEVEGAALEFVSLYDAAYHHTVMDSPDLWHPQKSFEVIAQKVILPLMRPLYEILAGYDPEKTLVVASGLAFGARLAQEKLNLPLVTIHLQPNIFLSTYDLPVIPGLPVPGWTPHPLKRWLMGAIDRTVLERYTHNLDPTDYAVGWWLKKMS